MAARITSRPNREKASIIRYKTEMKNRNFAVRRQGIAKINTSQKRNWRRKEYYIRTQLKSTTLTKCGTKLSRLQTYKDAINCTTVNHKSLEPFNVICDPCGALPFSWGKSSKQPVIIWRLLLTEKSVWTSMLHAKHQGKALTLTI